MVSKTALARSQDEGTEILLWKSVIARTVKDWLSTSPRPKLVAEHYLFENSRDLSIVCGLAGINVDHLRRCLNKVRGATLENLLLIVG